MATLVLSGPVTGQENESSTVDLEDPIYLDQTEIDDVVIGFQTTQQSDVICDQNAQPLATAYNEYLQEVPWFLRWTLENREIHVVVHNDTQENYSFYTGSNGAIESFEAGTPSSPSVRVTTSCESFITILSADDHVSTFWSEYENERVTIVGIGFFNWLLIAILKNPLLAAGIGLLILLLVALLVYYYVRRRRMVQRTAFYDDEGSE